MKRAHEDISSTTQSDNNGDGVRPEILHNSAGIKGELESSASAEQYLRSGGAGGGGGEGGRRKCPYLDTINRNVLDFDFEKLCSVSLSNNNVYACLVCGKYFQGRGRNTHAYTHSVQHAHHVFINLRTCRVYCLPDSYEVVDSSLEDIKRALDPRFSPKDIAGLDKNTTLSRDQYGVAYLPGFVGLNNLKCTDFVNVVLHALAHVPPLRNFFVEPENYKDCKSDLVHAFGEVVRRIWSPSNFKSAVSPHEFIQAVSYASKKRFRPGVQAEAVAFLSWLLNALHLGLASTVKTGSSIIFQTFQGLVEVETLTKKKKATSLVADDDDSQRRPAEEPDDDIVAFDEEEWDAEKVEVPFL